jgi:hypothetical protein
VLVVVGGGGRQRHRQRVIRETQRWDQHRAGYIQRKLSSSYIRDEQLKMGACTIEMINNAGGAIPSGVGRGSVAKVLSRSYTLDPSIRGLTMQIM